MSRHATAAPTRPDDQPRAADRRLRGEAGITLVELMVAMAIMAVALVIVGSTLVSASNASRRLDATSNAVDQARLASDRLDRDLRSAQCITSPIENQAGNTLVFQTLSSGTLSEVTYEVSGSELIRRQNLQPDEVVASPIATTSTAFSLVASPLRTVVVDLPVRSNGSILHIQTTIAGRNAWRTC